MAIDGRSTPERRPLVRAHSLDEIDERIDEALDESFPASDPPPWTTGVDDGWALVTRNAGEPLDRKKKRGPDAGPSGAGPSLSGDSATNDVRPSEDSIEAKNDVSRGPRPVGPGLHKGSCHCGAVRFEVTFDPGKATRCNCTVCTKTAVTSAPVKPGAFRLLTGQENLGEYVWGGKISTRFFCKTCGVQCFGKGHLAELGGDFVSVYLNLLDDIDLKDVEVSYWDGRHNNWQAGARSAPWPI